MTDVIIVGKSKKKKKKTVHRCARSSLPHQKASFFSSSIPRPFTCCYHVVVPEYLRSIYSLPKKQDVTPNRQPTQPSIDNTSIPACFLSPSLHPAASIPSSPKKLNPKHTMSDTGRDAAAPSPSPSTNERQQHHHLLQQQQAQQPSAPSFEPLFAIVNNATTNATSHPRVRYLFTDDDPSIIHEQQHHQQQQLPHDPPPHRNIVVDLIPDTSTPSAAANLAAPSAESDAASIGTNAAAGGGGAWRVGWASSLDPDFAVTSSAVTLQQGEEGDGATMLTIEGVEREPVDVSGGPLAAATAASSPAPGGSAAAAGAGESGALKGSGSGSGSGVREDVEGLVDDFKRRMGILGKVVAEGERRRAAVGHRDDGRAEQQQQETPGGGGAGAGGPEPGFDPKTIERPASKASISQR